MNYIQKKIKTLMLEMMSRPLFLNVSGGGEGGKGGGKRRKKNRCVQKKINNSRIVRNDVTTAISKRFRRGGRGEGGREEAKEK